MSELLKLVDRKYFSIDAYYVTNIGHANLFWKIIGSWILARNKTKKLFPAPTDILVISCLPMFLNHVLFLVSQMLKYKQSDCVFSPHSPQVLRVFKGLPSQHPKSPSSPLSMVPRTTVQVSIYLHQICIIYKYNICKLHTLDFHY